MTLQYLQKKKHMFKKRYNRQFYTNKKLKLGSTGFKLLKSIRYELVYFRLIKKIFKQKHIRRKIKFYKAKYWVFLNLNYILTSKSTNSRMGSGVGSTVRISIRLKSGTIFLETLRFSPSWMLKVYNKLRFKYPFKFKVICGRRC